MEKRGGISSLLASIRIFLGNPLARILFKLASQEVTSKYDGNTHRKSLVYLALTSFSGEGVQCPLYTRFIMELINDIIRVGIGILRGNVEEAKNALKDPAIRRGVSLVFEGIAKYGVTAPQKLPAPFLIVWNFTNMCNMRCKHCYQRASRPLPDELTLSEKLKLVEELDKAGVAAVALSGGEPTIHPDFLTAVKAISSRGMYAAVATNGWMFANMDFLKKAKEAGLRYVEVSIDSAYPYKHDEFRGVKGSWERAVKALENAVKLGINNAMAVTLTKYNIDEVDEILDLAESIGVKRVVFFNFVPVGRGRNIVSMDIDPIEREKFLRKIYREMKRRGMEIEATAPQYGRVVLQMSSEEEVAPTHYYVGNDPIVKSLAEFVGGCGAGRIYAGIQPNGDVIPCVFLPLKVGSIRDKDFREIWETSEILYMLRKRELLKGFCNKCPYRNICGGCRARAYSYFRDLLAPDPGCIYNLKYWKLIKREDLASKTPITRKAIVMARKRRR